MIAHRIAPDIWNVNDGKTGVRGRSRSQSASLTNVLYLSGILSMIRLS